MKPILKAHREFSKTVTKLIKAGEWAEAMRKHLRADIAHKHNVTEKEMDAVMNEVIDRALTREVV